MPSSTKWLRPRLAIGARAWMNSGKRRPTMGRKLSAEQKGHLADQLFEVKRLADNGTRPYDRVRQSLQDIIEGKFGSSGSSSLIHGMYTSQAEQFVNIRNWNDD